MEGQTGRRADSFGTEKVSRLLLRLAPPVMLAQLIQALYNIVDSYFVGQYSVDGLAALSVIFPVQLLMTALAIGIGVGVNTVMARADGTGQPKEADRVAGVGVWLALLAWAVFAAFTWAVMPLYARISLSAPAAQAATCSYGRIVCGCSIGIFLESNWTKVLQARGNMRLPMAAQILGAVVNIVLDRVLIFGLGPVLALTTCIVPLLSYNYAAGAWDRCRAILWQSVGACAGCMVIGTVVFLLFPTQLLSIFAAGESGILTLGTPALRIIAIGFVPIVWSLIVPTYFQAISKGGQSIFISVLRQILLLIPLAWGLSFLGVQAVWWAFPITEYITAGATIFLYKKYPMPRADKENT